MTRAAIPLAFFVALAGMFWYVLGQMNEGEYNPREVPTQFIGREAPRFELPDLFDPEVKVRSADMAGQVWLLNVWGTWCPECWKEHDYLLHLAQREGVPIVGLNWRDDAAEAEAMRTVASTRARRRSTSRLALYSSNRARRTSSWFSSLRRKSWAATCRASSPHSRPRSCWRKASGAPAGP